MNSRSFIKSILLAAVAPTILLPKFSDATKWKRTEALWVPNPEWDLATHEIVWSCNAIMANGEVKRLESFQVWQNVMPEKYLELLPRSAIKTLSRWIPNIPEKKLLTSTGSVR